MMNTRRHDRARPACRRVPQAARRPRYRRQHHRPILHRQRPALQHLAGRRHHALPQREELELGRRLPRSLFRPLARPLPGWRGPQRHRLPRRLAAHLRRRRRQRGHRGAVEGGRRTQRPQYKNYIDGAPTSSTTSAARPKESPRKSFMYVNDDGQIVAMRYEIGKRFSWKTAARPSRSGGALHRTPRAAALQSAPRPVRKGTAQLEHLQRLVPRSRFILAPMQRVAGKFLMTMKEYPPSQNRSRRFHSLKNFGN
jgi:hypothetical protein